MIKASIREGACFFYGRFQVLGNLPCGSSSSLRNADQLHAMAGSFARSLLRSLSVSRRGAKALGFQDDRDSINLLSGITRL